MEAQSNNVLASGTETNASSTEKKADRASIEEHVVNIDKWASSLARILEDVPPYVCIPGHPARISRIPQNLREVDTKAYGPFFLSIGPYHHGKARLQQMEKRKRLILRCILEQRLDLTLKGYLKEIKSIEPLARRFYSDVEMESEKFVHMLLLDSLYILTMFCGMATSRERMGKENNIAERRVDNEGTGARGKQIDEDMDTVNGNDIDQANREMTREKTSGKPELPRWFWTFFVHDILLLENQLPFFVLQKIYFLTYGGPEAQLISIMKDRVGKMLMDYIKLGIEMEISPTEEAHHILHLCHMFFRQTHNQEPTGCQLPETSQMFRLGNAMQLYEGEVSFEARSDDNKCCLLDITFDTSGKMVMPCLHVDDNTGSFLRNLIALEQMKYPSLGLNVSAYAVLLLHLVTIPDDVKLLRRKGIIRHHLASDKEMMYFVNRLSMGLAFDYVDDKYSLKPVFQELKRYTEQNVPRWRAGLKHRYFRNHVDDYIVVGGMLASPTHHWANLLYCVFLLLPMFRLPLKILMRRENGLLVSSSDI